MKNFMLFAGTFLGILAAIWLALRVAGTDWSIPYALVLIVVVLVTLRRTA